jgi:RNA polymerase sigma factor (TIGR02999 family)
MTDVTRILNAIEQGDARAADKLLPLVYEELRCLAAWKMSQELPGQTLQATALVHEAYLRLVAEKDRNWNSRTHFFGTAAEAMRRILIENARRKHRIKHGGGRHRIELQDADVTIQGLLDDIVALDEVLTKLESVDEVKSKLVKLRFFAGLTLEEAADTLGISQRTAKRYWRYARAWLYNEIGKGD